MPLYEYQCKQCGHRFEKIQSFSAPEEKECPVCKGEVERLISAPALQFKGSGWYVNDYAGKSKAANAPSKADSAKSEGGGAGESGSKGGDAASSAAAPAAPAASANASAGSKPGSGGSSSS